MNLQTHPVPNRQILDRLDTLARAMSHPAFELCTDEAALIVSAVSEAVAAGVRLDPLTIALVGVLRRQISDGISGDCDDSDFTEGDGDTFGQTAREFQAVA